MRLLNTRTKRLETRVFYEPNLPRYAALSHTWEGEEVTFQDIADPAAARRHRGWPKISAACDKALEHGFDYIWIDTCCIDKQSSAELSEAINSMFFWYEQSAECIVYLSDYRGHLWSFDVEKLAQCRWFTRAWTLQELLAPSKVSFHDEHWAPVGTKESLCDLIAHITGIPRSAILNSVPIAEFSIAQRMSWAAGRNTTRVEDMAYSLLGLFQINMPLLYGERDRAFLRLQEEILKQRLDLTILCWKAVGRQRELVGPGCLLAPSPLLFRECGGISTFPWLESTVGIVLSTAKGIQMNDHIYKFFDESSNRTRYHILVGKEGPRIVTIELDMVGPNTWARRDHDQLGSVRTSEAASWGQKIGPLHTSYFVAQAHQLPKAVVWPTRIRTNSPRLRILEALPETFWDDNRRHFYYYAGGDLRLLRLRAAFARHTINAVLAVFIQAERPPRTMIGALPDHEAELDNLETLPYSARTEITPLIFKRHCPNLSRLGSTLLTETPSGTFSIHVTSQFTPCVTDNYLSAWDVEIHLGET